MKATVEMSVASAPCSFGGGCGDADGGTSGSGTPHTAFPLEETELEEDGSIVGSRPAEGLRARRLWIRGADAVLATFHLRPA